MLTKKALVVGIFSSLVYTGAFAASAPAPNSGKVTLMGTITSTTCTVDINGTAGGTTVDTGIHAVGDFTTPGSMAVGGTVPLVVDLKDCVLPDPAGTAETDGQLIITGNVAANGNNNIFVGSDTNTGFIIFQESGNLDEANSVKNNVGIAKALGAGKTKLTYTYRVAMASAGATPGAGVYTAPITISYVTP